MTWRAVAARARAQAAGLDALGIAAGERIAIVSQNSARLFTSFFGVSGWGRVLVPINFRLNADEISYIVEHSGATMLLVDPELDDALAGRRREATRFVIGAETDAELYRGGSRAPTVGRSRRGRHRDHQLHERHDRAAQRRAAHAPQHLAERDDVRLADRRSTTETC